MTSCCPDSHARASNSRGRLTEGEAGELDEHHFDRNIAFAGVVKQASRGADRRGTGEQDRVDGTGGLSRELEIALTEGADNAVFSSRTGIDGERHTRTSSEVVTV